MWCGVTVAISMLGYWVAVVVVVVVVLFSCCSCAQLTVFGWDRWLNKMSAGLDSYIWKSSAIAADAAVALAMTADFIMINRITVRRQSNGWNATHLENQLSNSATFLAENRLNSPFRDKLCGSQLLPIHSALVIP